MIRYSAPRSEIFYLMRVAEKYVLHFKTIYYFYIYLIECETRNIHDMRHAADVETLFSWKLNPFSDSDS